MQCLSCFRTPGTSCPKASSRRVLKSAHFVKTFRFRCNQVKQDVWDIIGCRGDQPKLCFLLGSQGFSYNSMRPAIAEPATQKTYANQLQGPARTDGRMSFCIFKSFLQIFLGFVADFSPQPILSQVWACVKYVLRQSIP